jgi:O-antigen/teichoic acid export membrane protein
MLALRGGAELVALWAQVASVIDLVTGVAATGVGTGLAVYVARTRRRERQHDFLREALRIGLGLGAPLAVLAGSVSAVQADALSGGRLGPGMFLLAAAAAWIAIIPTLVNSYWVGQQHRERMLALALGAAALALFAAWAAPGAAVVPALIASQAIPAAALAWVAYPRGRRSRFRARSHPLRRYILPGLAIGLLGPASLLVARGQVGEVLTWHEAGVLQALWRLSDWVSAFAGGLLAFHYLPRFSAARGTALLTTAMLDAAKALLLPSALAFGVLWLLHRPLLRLLYGPGFEAGDAAAALFFAGSLVRIASWIPLFALYAMRRTRAIAAGEVLSLPLFAAALVWMGERATLEAAGMLWLGAYSAYAGFNLWAARRAQ